MKRSTSQEPSTGKANGTSEDSAMSTKRSKSNDPDTDYKSSMTINDFPDEILVKIMAFLRAEDMLVVQEVCQRWERLSQDTSIWMDKNFIFWNGSKTTPLSYRDKIGIYCSVQYPYRNWPRTLAYLKVTCRALPYNETLKRMPQLRICALPCERLAVQALYTNCPYITKLEITTPHDIDMKDFGNLVKYCPLIQILTVPVCFMKDEFYSMTMACLKFLQALSLHVDVSNSNILPVVLNPLAYACQQLRKLDLWGFEISYIGHFFIARPPLEELACRWTDLQKRCVIPSLLDCRDTLQYLQLHEYDVLVQDSYQVFRMLGALNNLTWLELRCVKKCPGGAMAEAFRSGGLSKLEHIDLSNSWAFDCQALKCLIEGCPNVRNLILFGCHRLTDNAFKTIHKLSQLIRLNVSRCSGLGPSSIPYIALIPKLCSLWLEYTDFKRLRPGINHILDMKPLRHLFMGTATNLHYVPIYYFPMYLPDLKVLDVQCTRLDPDFMRSLKEKMPHLCLRYTDSLYFDSDESPDEEY